MLSFEFSTQGSSAFSSPLDYLSALIYITDNRLPERKPSTQNVKYLNHWIKLHGDLALDLVRIYLGIGLMIKACYFMSHSDDLLQMMDNGSSLWFPPAILFHYLILAHLCGGFCLTLGMLTCFAAVIQLPILFAALFFVHMPHMVASMEARQSAEFAGLVLFLLALISVYGAGRWSMGFWLDRKEGASRYAPDSHLAKTI